MDYNDWKFQLPDLNQTIQSIQAEAANSFVDYRDWRFAIPDLNTQMIEAEAQNSWPPKIDMSSLDTEYWKKTWEGALTLPEIFVVDNNPWQGNAAFNDVAGWTTCDKDKKSCQIYIRRNADRDQTEPHEKMHAAGWDHPGYLQHLPGYLKPIK